MHPTSRPLLFGILLPLAWGLAAAPAGAQPVEIDPRLVIQEASAAYLGGPTAEEVVATLRVEGAEGRRPTVAHQRFTVRMVPAAPGGENVARVRIELGDVTVFLEQGRLTAASRWNDERVLVREFEGLPGPADLAAVLPPIPAPQLALIADQDFSAPTPYTPGVRWLRASADPAAALPLVLLEGQGPHGPVTVVTDAETGRLLRLTAAVSTQPPAMLDLLFEPVDPGDPAGWRIESAGRETVALATELAGSGQPAPAAPEAELVLRDAQGDPWTPGMNERAGLPPPVAIIAVPSDGDRVRSLRAAAQALAAIDHAEAPIVLEVRAAVAFPLGGFSASRFDELRRAWSAELERRGQRGDDLLWAEAVPPAVTQALSEGDAALLLVGPAGDHLGVIALRVDDAAERIAGEISRLLGPRPSTPDPPGG